ncbi:hypothetical protein CBR_g34125 [Chara braunii]|uniref:Uncharacterized protein n=1 Tax=Chara braunii TaxID=69332 RepID=A0A388LIA0_CHABU|nr:hypothetical protein CBR_g34125 [Chara braunii]|eukprot:GBG81942.1 hypothetical protein CBR_g34125 [Chara braunii]
MKGVTIGAKQKEKAIETPPSSDDDAEEDEAEEEATPLKGKRKRRDSTGAVENSPPVETSKKQGRKESVETPASQKRKGRGRPTKAEAQATRMAKGEDPWEGVPMGEKFATETAYRKAVRKAIGAFYSETLKAMCKGVGLPFYGVNDVIDTLSELRVRYCFRGDDLRKIEIYVTKRCSDVLNEIPVHRINIVVEVIELLVFDVAREHEGKLTTQAAWEAFVDPSLVDREYLQGAICEGALYDR